MKREAQHVSVDQAVEAYVASRRSKLSLVSTKEAVDAIRAMAPDCEHLGDEIASLVAAAAIRAGFAVFFDDLHNGE